MSCEPCQKKHTAEPVPYIVHESSMAQQERHISRISVALIVAIALIFVSNLMWLYAWCQYDYECVQYQQDGEGLNIIGNDNEAGIYGTDCTN